MDQAPSYIPLWAAAVSAVVAVVGLVIAYFLNRNTAKILRRTDRVEKQLQDFYGPLLALSSATNATWGYFRSRYRHDIAYFAQDPPPSAADLQA